MCRLRTGESQRDPAGVPCQPAIRSRGGRARWAWPLRVLRGALGVLSFFGPLAIPAPDRPVVGAAVLLAFEVETRDGLEDLEPGAGVAANLDLRPDRPKRVERLVEQV